ncbi:hypothetical protein T492DRAFT_889238, partial [Pavlovales sp. CCMP2436]
YMYCAHPARIFDAEGEALWEAVISRCLAVAPRSGHVAMALSDGVLLLGTPDAHSCVLRSHEFSDGHPAEEALASLLCAAPSALSMLSRDGRTLIDILIEKDLTATLDALMNHDSGLSAWVDEGSFALCAARMNAHAFGLLLRLVVRPGGCRYPGKARVAAARSLIDAVALGASKTVASFVGSMELEALGAVAASTGATPAADGMAGTFFNYDFS